MYLDELQEQTIRGWISFLKTRTELQREAINETPVLSSGNKYNLGNYNAIQSTIVLSNGRSLSSYLPYDENEQQISAIIVSGGTEPFTASYKYNPFAILTRSQKRVDRPSFATPKLFVLWGNSVRQNFNRQQKDGKAVARRRCYLTINIDVEEDQGGYATQSDLLSKVIASIESNKSDLYELGFEDVEVEEIPASDDGRSENPLTISRGVIMVAFTAYAEIRR